MYCTKCGAELKEDALFCTKCGEKIVFVETVSEADVLSSESETVEPTKPQGIEIKEKQPVQPDYSELVEKAKNKDNDAFTKLFEMTQKKAYYTALKILKNEDDAQDVLQEAYIKAFTSIGSLADNSKFQSWFNCIVANLSKNMLAKKKPSLFSDFESEQEDIDASFESNLKNEDSSLVPHEVADNKETRRLVMNCIDNLSDEQKICILMFYYDELSISDIATALEVPENTVKTRLFHARKKLKCEFESLEKQGTKLFGAGIGPIIKSVLGAESIALPEKTAFKILSATLGAISKGVAASAASATTITAASAAGIGATAKIIIASVAVAAIAAGAGAGVIVHNNNEKATTVEATTQAEIVEEATTEEAIVLDAEHQANIDEAMQYSTGEYKTRTYPTAAVADDDYIYIAEPSKENNIGTISMINRKTGKKQVLLNSDAESLLLIDNVLVYVGDLSGEIWEANIYIKDLTNNNAPIKINNSEIFVLPMGTTEDCNLHIEDEKICFYQSAHYDYPFNEDDDVDYFACSAVYDLKTNALEVENPKNINSYDSDDSQEYKSTSLMYEDEDYIIIETDNDYSKIGANYYLYNLHTGEKKKINYYDSEYSSLYGFNIIDDSIYFSRLFINEEWRDVPTDEYVYSSVTESVKISDL